MKLLRPLFAASIALAAGIAPLLLALAVPGSSREKTAAPTTPQQVADTLDSIIQPRFQDLTAGNFGMSRLVPAVQGHPTVGSLGALLVNTPTEAALLARADAARRPYVIAFLHCAAVPGASASISDAKSLSAASAVPEQPFQTLRLSDYKPQLRTIVVKGGYDHDTESRITTAVIKALPAAVNGRSVQADAGEWTVFLRPITASENACLSCHTTAKRGDTLGVMVYSVSRIRTVYPPISLIPKETAP